MKSPVLLILHKRSVSFSVSNFSILTYFLSINVCKLCSFKCPGFILCFLDDTYITQMYGKPAFCLCAAFSFCFCFLEGWEGGCGWGGGGGRRGAFLSSIGNDRLIVVMKILICVVVTRLSNLQLFHYRNKGKMIFFITIISVRSTADISIAKSALQVGMNNDLCH